MNILALALKSNRCKRFSSMIVFIQLSVCFAILIYSASAVFSQFDVIYTANGTHRGWLRISINSRYIDKNACEYPKEEHPDIFKMYYEYLEQHGLTREQELTAEQYDEVYADYMERAYKIAVEHHHRGLYQYPDFYEKLERSGLAAETSRNYHTFFESEDNGIGETVWSVDVFHIDVNLYDGLKLRTKLGADLRDKPSKENYYYALMYPFLTSQGVEIPEQLYGVGDVLTYRRYNENTHRYETYYYEIVDELQTPAYVFPDIYYSGYMLEFECLEGSFLGAQTLDYNGALIALKPEGFDETTTSSEMFTLVKPRPDLTETEYSELLELIRECGFNVIDLDEAERNTINDIWEFIRENCLILVASVLMVVFSIISISVLSGGQVRREYAVYRLCGADLRKVKALSAVKWALIFIPAMAAGILIAILYSKISETSTHFIVASALVSGVLFALLYIASFIMSYKSASAGYESSELSE